MGLRSTAEAGSCGWHGTARSLAVRHGLKGGVARARWEAWGVGGWMNMRGEEIGCVRVGRGVKWIARFSLLLERDRAGVCVFGGRVWMFLCPFRGTEELGF